MTCGASTCTYALFDNITRLEAHLRTCDKALSHFSDMLLTIGASSAGSVGRGGSASCPSLGEVCSDELESWR